MTPKVLARFMRYVDATGGMCWEWKGARRSHGYGVLGVGGVAVAAHRLMWEHNYGAIPPGLCVMHVCDNRACVNPGHLVLGTHRANMLDMARKGRAHTEGRPGEANPMHKLTERQVADIRRCGLSQRSAARRFGVSRWTVRAIRSGQRWAHSNA